MPITIPGRLPDALVNSSHVVHLKPDDSTPAPNGMRIQPLSDKKAEAAKTAAEKCIAEGRVTDLNPLFSQQEDAAVTDRYEDRYEGKTVIDNAGGPVGFIVGSTLTPEGEIILGPGYGAARAAAGAPDHAFFYHDTDFLTDAAQKYATLGENEVFRYRDIQDQIFVQDTLDFFTNGNYTYADITAVQEQMTDVVQELAQQIKEGKSPDLSQLQTKVTIGGVDVAFSQLLDFQRVGGKLKGSFDGLSLGQLDTKSYAEMGIAKAVGDYYGNGKGAAGEMFSAAMDRLYEKGVALLEKTAAQADPNGNPYTSRLTQRGRDGVKTSNDVRDMFSKLDISSKEDFAHDFHAKLSQMRTMVQEHCNKYAIPTAHVGLAGDTADITQFFTQWMDLI